MRSCSKTLAALMIAGVLLNSCIVANKPPANPKYEQLVEALSSVPVTGPSIGPSTGITSNPQTDAVVHQGAAIVPSLIYSLDHSSWQQSVWIMFCLNELHAKAAKPQILELKKEIEHGRFASEPQDFTLDAGIDNYLAHVDAW